jgi:hypothetical protein
MKSNLAAGNIAVALLIVAIVGLRTHCPLSNVEIAVVAQCEFRLVHRRKLTFAGRRKGDDIESQIE